MPTKMYFRPIEMTSNIEGDWRTSRPSYKEMAAFCKETEEWVNKSNLRIVSVVPVTGGLDLYTNAGGTAMTCGFLIVVEGD